MIIAPHSELIGVSFSLSVLLGLDSYFLDTVSPHNEEFMVLCINQFELMESKPFHVSHDAGCVWLFALWLTLKPFLLAGPDKGRFSAT